MKLYTICRDGKPINSGQKWPRDDGGPITGLADGVAYLEEVYDEIPDHDPVFERVTAHREIDLEAGKVFVTHTVEQADPDVVKKAVLEREVQAARSIIHQDHDYVDMHLLLGLLIKQAALADPELQPLIESVVEGFEKLRANYLNSLEKFERIDAGERVNINTGWTL